MKNVSQLEQASFWATFTTTTATTKSTTSGHPPFHIPNKANKNENKINFF
jgi:hypothetical protein